MLRAVGQLLDAFGVTASIFSRRIRADPRSYPWRPDVYVSGPIDDRYALAGASTRGTLSRHPSGRGRDGDADAPGQTIHPKSRSRYPVARFLVLEVLPGRSSRCQCWRSPRSSATGSGRSPRSAIFSKDEGRPIGSAALKMNVEDYNPQGKRWCVRLPKSALRLPAIS